MSDLSPKEQQALRTKALIALAVTLFIGVGAWFGLTTATQRAIDRLAAIDRARATCAVSYNAARSRAETLLVDRIPLADTINARSDAALQQ